MMEHQNNSEQGNRSAATPSPSLGTMLREARERLGLSVADVAAQIKFAPRQIEALEADDFKHLPEAAFLRGFVRSYAKILHLDLQPLLTALPQAKEATTELIPPSVEVPYPAEHVPQRQTLVMLGAALLLAVIALGFSVWHFTNPLRHSTGAKIETQVPLPDEKQVIAEPPVQKHNSVASSDSAEPKRESSATVVQSSVRPAKTRSSQAELQSETADSGNKDDAATQTTTLRLVFDEESWTEITDKDGKIISSQVNPRGSELNVEGHLPLSLVIGHAATTHLYQDGEPVDLTPYINSSSVVARIILE
jgi:cytoskeleton protein RodZ